MERSVSERSTRGLEQEAKPEPEKETKKRSQVLQFSKLFYKHL